MTRRGVRTTVAIAALALAPPVAAQFGGFEIASVKPSNRNPTGPLGAAPMVLPALGRLTATNATLRLLVVTAYQKQPFQVVGGPAWQNTNRFDVNAKAIDPAVTTESALRAAEDAARRSIQVESAHRNPGDADTRPCAITTLPSTPVPGLIAVKATGQSVATLAEVLTQLTGRPVVDKTGLTGLYDFDLVVGLQTLIQMSAELGGTASPLPQGLPEAPALMTQLQEDLGLKLDSQRGPGEVLVIDSAELPAPD